MFASFGTQVTVLEKGTQVLPREDRDIAAAVQGVLENKGVQFKTHVNVIQIDGGTVVYEDRAAQEKVRLEGDAVLLAAGRRPNTEALELAKAGCWSQCARSHRGRRTPAHHQPAGLRLGRR